MDLLYEILVLDLDLNVAWLSVLDHNLIAHGDRRVMDEVPVNATAPIGAAHFLVVAEAEADDAGTVTVVSDERRFGKNLERRIEAKGKLAEHAGVAAGR